jgi:coenzyme F420 hydrogenase subunit beta
VDENIRMAASSGGMVTSLLVFLLKSGTIDGAIVTKMSEADPLLPNVFLATTEEQIIAAAQSKYCPVPVNMAIKQVIDKNLKIAVVGLPCHIQGLRKLELQNPKLKEKFILHLGLFCGHNTSFLGTEFVLEKMGIKHCEIKKLIIDGANFRVS